MQVYNIHHGGHVGHIMRPNTISILGVRRASSSVQGQYEKALQLNLGW